MNGKQKQTIEAFARVRTFLDAHPVEGPLTYEGPRETLDEVVRRLRELAGAQITGHRMSRAELRRQQELIRLLRDRHMRPIVAIAKAQSDPGTDVRLPEALAMPRPNLGATRMLAVCDSMIAAAREFEATFIANKRPADFLARFVAARDALEQSLGGRTLQIGTHVAARTGLQVQLRRGRKAVEHLDAVVREAFGDDPMTLAAWRIAKRVQLQAGGAGARTVVEDEGDGASEGLPQAA